MLMAARGELCSSTDATPIEVLQALENIPNVENLTFPAIRCCMNTAEIASLTRRCPRLRYVEIGIRTYWMALRLSEQEHEFLNLGFMMFEQIVDESRSYHKLNARAIGYEIAHDLRQVRCRA